MADPFVYSNRTGTAITGTASQSLLGAACTIPTVALEEETEFQALGAAVYLNNTGSAHNIDLDLTANGNLIHRSALYTLSANSLTRSVRAEYSIVVTESNTCMVTAKSTVSAAGNTGNDIRSVSTVEVGQTFDISAPVTLDWKATLSTVSDLPTHSLTPYLFRMNTLGTFTINVTTGGGGGGGIVTIEPGDIDVEDLPFEAAVYCEWGGSAYNARPAVQVFKRVFYTGPVEPNGVNSPGGPASNDLWIDTSGA